jgi:hypothetical protein
MPDLELNADEYEVMRSEQIRYGGAMANYTSDLVLTNQHILLIRRGVFGGAKKAERFPLRDVKVVQDRPQAIARDDSLEVHFVDRQEVFGFVPRRKKEIKVWATNISNLLVGDEDAVRGVKDKALPGAEYLAEAARDTLDALKRPFRSAPHRAEKVARSCTSCATLISGRVGRVVQCPSCGSDKKLQPDDR